jgi:hypothetical protein
MSDYNARQYGILKVKNGCPVCAMALLIDPIIYHQCNGETQRWCERWLACNCENGYTVDCSKGCHFNTDPIDK